MVGGPDSRLEMPADRLTDRQTTGLTNQWVITYICTDIAVVWGNDRRDNNCLRSLISNVIRIFATCDVLNEIQSTLTVIAFAGNNSSHGIYFVQNTINFHWEPCSVQLQLFNKYIFDLWENGFFNFISFNQCPVV